MVEDTLFSLIKCYVFLLLKRKYQIKDFVINELIIMNHINRRTNLRRGYLINYLQEKELLICFYINIK